MTSPVLRSLLIAAVSFGAACANTPGDAPSSGPLQLHYADPVRGVSATFDDGTTLLELAAWVDAANVVQSTITNQDGRVVTHMSTPLARPVEIAAQIGPLARVVAQDRTFADDDPAALERLVPVYERALTLLYDATENLGDSTLRMALPWHEEVLMRLLVVTDVAGGVVALADDACDYSESRVVHTNMLHLPAVDTIRRKAGLAAGHVGPAPMVDNEELAAGCDLNCSWYDVCCFHDEACSECDHWWCGWSCTKGCSGGDCGGGR